MAGLYVHVPFCVSKCHYCDFFSCADATPLLSSWHLWIERHLRLIARRPSPQLDSIFFGGGTPSLLSPTQITHILDLCRRRFVLAPGAEISLEANPGTLEARHLDAYLAAGINRLSIGVQSFNDNALRQLGRIHSGHEARQAVHLARQAGFKNISLDLIFALPGQKLNDMQQDIAQLLMLTPEHVGIYGLSIETGTRLHELQAQQRLDEIDEEDYVCFYRQIHDKLSAAGYEHYEISNFARPGYRCRHNQGYWQRQTCLAAGAGAHGFDAAGNGLRYEVPADLENYQRQLEAGRDPAVILETFTPAQAMSETLYLGLRTADGIDNQQFSRQFGQHPEQVFARAFTQIAPWLETKDGTQRLSLDGWLIYDQLIQHFLAA
jgi:oxygen-independent coproporphyrinogen-3 oxidase